MGFSCDCEDFENKLLHLTNVPKVSKRKSKKNTAHVNYYTPKELSENKKKGGRL
jgi:hypothetical protein